MIKVSEKLVDFLKLVKPIDGVNKLKLSSFRHPCHAREDHDLVKERILQYNCLLIKKS